MTADGDQQTARDARSLVVGRPDARVSAFPWGALDALTRSEVTAGREVRRWLAGYAEPVRLQAVLGELLRVPVRALVKRTGPVESPRGIAGGAGVLVAPAETPDLAHAVLVEAELALVAAVVGRVAEQQTPVVLGAGATAAPGAAGALGAVVVAALRKAHAGSAMCVLAAGPAPALEADIARAGGELYGVSLTVLLGDEAFAARVVVPRRAALAAPAPSWDVALLAALGPTPLALSVVAHAVRATASDVGALHPGDALVLPGWSLARTGTRGLSGSVALAPWTSPYGISAHLGEDGRLLLGGDTVPLIAAEEAMTEGVDTAELINGIGEVPVVVRVEIGQAVMAARDWAALVRGDVVPLGRRVGDPVVLRVGDVAVARGELVAIDGEVGVRIVERLSEETAR
jgi:flagellar motor switch/type III secretory pathway protein FliN